MVFQKFVRSVALLGAFAHAQTAQYIQNGNQISVNIPADTAAGSSQTIYFQMSAPSGTQWVGFGTGSQMSGSNMFVMYSASDSNVTISPRTPQGYRTPQFNSNAQITVLEGTGIRTDGSLIANVRCDNCLSWNGGTLDPKSSKSNWIWAYKSGSGLNTADTSADFVQHDQMGSFTLDLTQGTGGSSTNPFSPTSASGGSPAVSSGVSAPAPASSSSGSSSGSNSGSSSSYSSSDNTSQVRTAHAIIMSMVFVVLFPVAALTIYLPFAEKVRWVHAPLQVLSLILTIIGLALGVVLGQRVFELDGYHQIIGYLIVGVLILFQPALGIYQHLHYRKTGGRSPMGIAHRWLGRTMIILGVINGGLGFMQSGPVGSTNVPSYSVVAYCIVVGVIFFVYLSVLLAASWSAKHPRTPKMGNEKHRHDREHGGYQMQHSPQTNNYPAFPQQHPEPKRANTYTISNPSRPAQVSGYENGQGRRYQ